VRSRLTSKHTALAGVCVPRVATHENLSFISHRLLLYGVEFLPIAVSRGIEKNASTIQRNVNAVILGSRISRENGTICALQQIVASHSACPQFASRCAPLFHRSIFEI
jgi:hypothetical protein